MRAVAAVAPALLVTLLGCVSAPVVAQEEGPAADGETGAFLGPPSGWDACRVELHDVHGLWGGVAVWVEGSGRAVVQRVDASRTEARYALALGDDARALLRRAAEVDVLAVEVPDRPGVPDEARPRIVLQGPAGERREVSKWGSDEVAGLDAVLADLRAIAGRTGDRAPDARGPHDPAWRPFVPRARVEPLLYSGRPNPAWELTGDDLERLRAALEDLPDAEAVARPQLGFRGFLVRFRDGAAGPTVDDAPAAVVEVYRGTVLLQEADGAVRTAADAHDLEARLRAQAAERGVDLPD